jgi:VPDSG-CTERM motif
MLYASTSGMKPLPKLLLALTAVAAVSVAYPAKANLIVNPGFETGSGGTAPPWQSGGGQFTNGAVGTFNGVPPHSGIRQWAILGGQIPGTLSQSVATTPAATYTIAFFAATTFVQGPVSLTVTFGGTTVFSHLFTSDTGYTQYTANVTVPGSLSTLNFTAGGVGILLLDDVSVEPAGVGVPDGGTTVSLLGCALVGLAGLRRKLGC